MVASSSAASAIQDRLSPALAARREAKLRREQAQFEEKKKQDLQSRRAGTPAEISVQGGHRRAPATDAGHLRVAVFHTPAKTPSASHHEAAHASPAPLAARKAPSPGR